MPPLPAPIAAALADKGYDTLTPVQIAVSDPALVEADLLVSAQTGSGKTVAFGLAIAPTLLADAAAFGPAAAPLGLVIAPTRELAMQVRRELEWLYGPAGAQITSCVGGMDARDERRALGRGAHVVVATPGRLRDHIERGNIDLDAVRAVVLDEADEMLDLGFREDLEFILGAAPSERRTLMFSATVPPAIASLAQLYQKDARRISTRAETRQHADIAYRAMVVGPRDEENAIINVLRYYEAANAIVFCNTRAMVNRLTTRFSNRGFQVVALSGELTQSERTHALQAMRDGRAQVCVATDVAARGIDLPNLELVVHAELPSSSDTLLHRSGRTGRAGRKGVSAVIVPVKFRKKAERLLKWAKVTPDWVSPPSAEDVRAQDAARLLEDPAWETPVAEGEAEMVARLVEAFSPEQLAAAVLRAGSAQRSAPEEISAGDMTPTPRVPFGPSAWFTLSVGRASRAEPRWILPMLCRVGGFDRDEIGAIRIQQDETFVEIKEAAVPDTLQGSEASITLEDGAVLSRLAEAPDLSQRDGSGPARKPREGRGPVSSTRPSAAGRKPRAPRPAPEATRPEPAPAPASSQANDAPPARKPRHKDKPPASKGATPDGPKPPKAKPRSADRDRPKDRAPYSPKGGKAGGPRDDKGKPRVKDRKPPRPDAAAAVEEVAPRRSNAASDPSQRLGPDGKPLRARGKGAAKPAGKPGAKPGGKPGRRKTFASKGPDATPRWKKPKR
ncbi:DEAD/DEAH box helicase domain protein [Dinoroseobacter shibae DFL 12 = DSM 16493]|jgi:ATP-dependent RNA helicase DeaD|uniref:DEAD/DEAH box helicase domain protein n=1 Tax=Dinoroseobacter shibae (strain DSM 16493 / NCIMB 14021 / DFL 12) TaxID=398580 RepID=A8LRE5_DINSH|nr:DEAD/DEAH box helicase [Dinoroseobacter shibae]ABV92595.1 DEAD/DEAH box helicase domain protein [Dinoroseobacter shibae DFL 12 = DSM 16493]URF47538.1 DEAD/DEAH box helicase [Dinoroseobacter shibae]URF51848.1 DEAD/DEAH box helicase [Dinoroseobacter shibae]